MRIRRTKDTNYNIVPNQQTLFAFPPAALILEILCLNSLESGSILLLTINIYEPVNRPRELFIIIESGPSCLCAGIGSLSPHLAPTIWKPLSSPFEIPAASLSRGRLKPSTVGYAAHSTAWIQTLSTTIRSI